MEPGAGPLCAGYTERHDPLHIAAGPAYSRAAHRLVWLRASRFSPAGCAASLA